MFWTAYFIVYVLIGMAIDDEADSLMSRLGTALILLVWPLLIGAGLVGAISKRK